MTAFVTDVRKHKAVAIATAALILSLLGLGGAGFALAKQWQESAERAADRAERAADEKSANTAQVARCYQQIRDAPDVLKVLDLLDVLATSSIRANREAIEVGGSSDPLLPVRQASLRRLVPARTALRKFVRRSSKSVPKLADCDRRARKLHVNPKPFRRGLS